MTESDVLRLIYSALRNSKNVKIDDVSLDGDHKSAEIILTTDDGTKKQDWVIKADSISEAERNS